MNGNLRSSVQSGSASRRNNDVRQDLIARRAAHQAELEQLDEELLALEDLRRQQIQNIKGLTQQIEALDEGVSRGPAVIRNYFDEFEWSERLREQMRRVFGIEKFRLAQEGYAILVVAGILSFNKYINDDLFFFVGNSVCNANMDGRDIICIMPTGQWDISSPGAVLMDGWMDYRLPLRGREIAHIPATCNVDARVHSGNLASCIAHEGPDTTFAREPQSVKKTISSSCLYR